MSIIEIPELPKEIKEAYERRRLVLFIGAGISRLVGVKGWDDLANDLVNQLYSYGEAQQIKSSGMSSKEKITVAFEKAKEDKQEDEYWKVFESGIKPDPKLSVEDSIYRDISKINAIYLTTNCDGLLEQFLPTNVWTTDCKSKNLNDVEPPYIFYIHGRYGNGEGKETLVFTVDQYLERYNNNLNNEYIGFLKNVFNMYTVLFLGYGANEFELLDYLVEKAGEDDQRSNNAYILEGFSGFEEPLCKAKQRYYNDLRINLIPYNMDKNGYKQQLNVIRAWVNQLLTTSTYSGDTIKGIVAHLHDCTPENKGQIKYYIEISVKTKNASLLTAFSEIPKTKCFCDWLEYLWDSGLVKAADFPKIIVEEKGYKGESWEFLSCIKACMVKKPNDERLEDFTVRVLPPIISETEIEDKAKNWIAMGEVGEIIIRLDKNHIKEEDISFLEKLYDIDYLRISMSAGENIVSWLSWPDEYVSRIVSRAFRPSKNEIDHNAYWLNELKDPLINNASDNQLRIIYNICRKYLLNILDDSDYYLDFETRFSAYTDRYQNVIAHSITAILDRMPQPERCLKVSDLAKKAGCQTAVQMALFYATKYKLNFNFLESFSSNPLDYPKIFANFYYFIEMAIEAHLNLSDKVKMLVLSWIEKANFGIEECSEEAIKVYDDKEKNTYRFQLYELLKGVSPEFEEKYKSLCGTDIYSIAHPREEAQSRIPHVRTVEPKKYFSDNELDGLDATERLDAAEKKISEAADSREFYSNVEIYVELLRLTIHTEYADDMLEAILSRTDNELLLFTNAIWHDSVSEICLTDSAFTMLIGILSRIYTIKSSDEPLENRIDMCSILLSNFVYILQRMQRKQWKMPEILQFCLSIDPGELWQEEKHIEDDCDIISEIINTPESQFYILMAECACECRGSDTAKDFLSYILKEFDRGSNWVILSAAYEIQNLFFIDPAWAESHIINLFSSNKVLIPYCIATICSKTSYIFEQIIEFIYENDNLDDTIIKLHASKQDQRAYIERISNYIVAGYSLNYLNTDQYKQYICLLDPKDLFDIFRCVTLDINGKVVHNKREVFLMTYYLCKANCESKDLYRAVVENVSYIDSASEDIWKMICESVRGVGQEEYVWIYIQKAVVKFGAVYYHDMTDTVLAGAESHMKPELNGVKVILQQFEKLGKEDDVKKICSLLIRKQVFPVKMAEIIEDPKILVDEELKLR